MYVYTRIIYIYVRILNTNIYSDLSYDNYFLSVSFAMCLLENIYIYQK